MGQEPISKISDVKPFNALTCIKHTQLALNCQVFQVR